jgi:D-lactate dehydrogenase (cytochrome)
MNTIRITDENREDYSSYLTDESRTEGRADSISFPLDAGDVSFACARSYRDDVPITVQGARTGITGGGVSFDGHLISTERMTGIGRLRRDETRDCFIVTVGSGLTLDGLRTALTGDGPDRSGWDAASLDAYDALRSGSPYFLPPDPTESTASIGGMIATNASGARSFGYGAVRRYVHGIRIVLADGRMKLLHRGDSRAQGFEFTLPFDDGSSLGGRLPSYSSPDVKNAAGYFSRSDMDLVDLFIGAEGTLAVVCEADLVLVRKPGVIHGITVFFPGADEAIRFIRTMRDFARAASDDRGMPSAMRPCAIEFFDARALAFLERSRTDGGPFADFPRVPDDAGSAVYIELHGRSGAGTDAALDGVVQAIDECGGSDDATWFADDEKELARFRRFRHAVPEAVNRYIASMRRTCPDITKLGTDMAVPDDFLEQAYMLYTRRLTETGLDYVIFGHAGDNHLHVNILPKTAEEYAAGRTLYEEWARWVVSMGGTVSAEHGIGKLKTPLLRIMYSDAEIAGMLGVKRLFDPKLLLGRGTLFGSSGFRS